ncbi:phosphoenolpyruvate--protein phosphotransferase [Nordella sp. HKS 07]|uniref:phosphoenolpyruvate--protein phosphotransferase n=1 Tax=Nordella sp. HKS 07 TaxID=2712222 RepID=UPI0013E19009|nr:phosphoenolpyruvate--protein phosphotransferase [Nordella sp. HKS 07]QIG48540.1 phosphoenolpyruvate--protein phosphotransferase [Nordella sp. HKS 07]
MRQAVELKGKPASDGIFAGPIFFLGATRSGRRVAGDAEAERRALDAAVAAAIAGLTTLVETAPAEGAEMLGFQIALLEDEALLEPAHALIAQGIEADAAWRKTVEAEIVGYELSDDDYFRARAADLKDMRDRVLRALSGESASLAQAGAILIGDDVPPSLFLEADWSKGGAIALSHGSPSSHVAILARGRGVPMVVGLGDIVSAGHAEAVIDGALGLLVLSPDMAQKKLWSKKAEALAAKRAREARFLAEPARLKDGSRIELLINVAGPEELESLDPRFCDGIGLMRSEFLFRDGQKLPDEEMQYSAYRSFLDWAEGRPVTIRTLDIGGDKPIKGFTPEGERNPFLGQRGVRLTLEHVAVFKAQLRALVRAAVHGNLKIMLPMVTIADELDRSAALLDEVMTELTREGIAAKRPPLGIMVEVPAVAVAPELLAKAAFFSIGSNDLTQYVMAAARDEAAVANLSDPAHPAVLSLIANVTRFGREQGIPVSLCGDMASEPRHLKALIAAGLRTLSVSPASIARVKAALADIG